MIEWEPVFQYDMAVTVNETTGYIQRLQPMADIIENAELNMRNRIIPRIMKLFYFRALDIFPNVRFNNIDER